MPVIVTRLGHKRNIGQYVRLTPTMATFLIYEGMIDIAGNQYSGGGGLMLSVGLLKLCLWSIFAIYDGNIAAFIYFFGRPTRSRVYCCSRT